MKKLFYLLTSFSSLIFADAKPNIVYILADDMGYGDVKAYNKDCKFPTPHLDSMAENGMIFTDSHTNSSVCTPTRYGIMTGRYAWRTRLKEGVQNGYGASLIEPDRMTLASLLKNQGYNTACIGKWHIGMDWALTSGNSPKAKGDNVDHTTPIKNGPVDVGFDYYFGLAGSLGMPPHCFIENRKLIAELDVIHKDKKGGINKKLHSCRPGFASSDFDVYQVLNQITDKAVAYIEDQSKQKKPFFLYFPLNAPHAPVTPHKDFQAKSNINAYADFCMEVDWRVGQIIKALKDQGIYDNTLIVFTTDNGCSGTAKIDQLLAVGHNPSAHFRGIKGNLYEGGHRVPFLIQWPKSIKAGSVSDKTICTTDFLATLADMNNVDLKDNQGEDSVSFLAALKGESSAKERAPIIHHSDQGKFAIRKDKWVLVMDPGSGSKRQDGFSSPVKNPAAIQLFDLAKDPSQTTNLQAQNPEIVSQLKKQLMSIIDKGRSTPGTAQKNASAKKGWAHYDELSQK